MTELAKRAVKSIFNPSRLDDVESDAQAATVQMVSREELLALCKSDLSAFCPATRA